MSQEDTTTSQRYRASGVDIDTGNALVETIKPLARATARPGAEAALGGFAGLFDLKAAGYRDPVLLASTDGVGTKLKVAVAAGKHDTVGLDLVAMCVNDLVVHGAEPLFFLDYFATGRLEIATCRAVVEGIARGCREAGCALIGGETAEMPGMYAASDYDLAGFAVGAAERGQVLTGASIEPGDLVLGLASTGLHSNGFSFVRRLVADLRLDYAAPAPFAADRRLGEALLTPTRIYVKSCLSAIRSGGIKALAHITGGGLVENLPRVLPDSVAAELDAAAWALPAVFRWLKAAGAVPVAEMLRTFNCGIGMAVITSASDADRVTRLLAADGETVCPIGRIAARPTGAPAVVFHDAERAWAD